MNLYIFDFDGTVYNGDSMFDFLKSLHRNKIKYYFFNIIFIPFVIFRFLKIINIESYKSIFLKIHLNTYKKKHLLNHSKQFSKKIKNKIFPKFKKYKNSLDGEKCIVSASVDIWMEDIAKELNMSLICTESIFKNGKFEKILINCNHQEKKNRIIKKYDLNSFRKILVFGDSKGDYNMYELGIQRHNFFKES